MSTGMGRILRHAHRLSRYSRRASTFSATGSRSFSARPTIHSKLDQLLNVQEDFGKKMNVLVDSKILLLLEIQKMLNVQRELGENLNLHMNMLVDSKIQLMLEIQKMLYVQSELREKLNLHSQSPGQIQVLFEKANEPKHPVNKFKDSPAWSVVTMSISVLAFAKFLNLDGRVTQFMKEKEKAENSPGLVRIDADKSVGAKFIDLLRKFRRLINEKKEKCAIWECMTRKDHADVSNQSVIGEGTTRKDHADVSNQSTNGEDMTRKDHADVSSQSTNGEDMTRKDHADVSSQSAIGEGMTRKDHADVSNQS